MADPLPFPQQEGWNSSVLVMQDQSAAHHRVERVIKERQLEIGLILCQQPVRVLAEYALRGIDQPIGASSDELARALPMTLQTSLPSIEAIEQAPAHEAADEPP
jgi:hypothetical protein